MSNHVLVSITTPFYPDFDVFSHQFSLKQSPPSHKRLLEKLFLNNWVEILYQET